MAFEDLKETANTSALKEGERIYKELCLLFPEKSIEHLDLIMNSLCAALIFLIRDNVSEDDYKGIIQVIHKILTKNC